MDKRRIHKVVLSELKRQVDFLIENGHDDDSVLVTLSESSIGSRAATGLTGIYAGFDWEHGQIRISTDKKIISYEKDRDKVIEARKEDYNNDIYYFVPNARIS